MNDNNTINNDDIIIGNDIIIDNSQAEREMVWETLVDQIVKRNVIPVIGSEMVKIQGKPSERFFLDQLTKYFKVYETMPSFTALINHIPHKVANKIYSLTSSIIQNNPKLFEPSELLTSFLSIPYFPFVITTTVDPTVENAMHKIYGDKLRILSFWNDPRKNDDIHDSSDVTQPTLYYMFGNAKSIHNKFVLTDTDLLRFSRSWLLPKDSSNLSKPSNLSNALSNKYLLVLGNNFRDWLFRFFWFAIKDEKLNNGMTPIPNGMETSVRSDSRLIEFLNYANITLQTAQLSEFVNELKERITDWETENYADNDDIYFSHPNIGADIFISYSRADSPIAKKLYDILSARGLKVWYDRKNLGVADDFKKEIRNAIRTCKLFIPILSNHITEQAADEHIYRLEWDWALEHNRLISPAIRYIAPLTEEGFNITNKFAGFPEKFQNNNVFIYRNDSKESNLNTFADQLYNLLNNGK